MSFFAYTFFLGMIATNGIAFPFMTPVLDEFQSIEKMLSESLGLSARMRSKSVLRFEVQDNTSDPKIPDLLKTLGLTTLQSLLVQAGLIKVLSGSGPFTLFGPTNEAINNLPSWAKEALANKTILTNVLLFHVLPANVPSSALKSELLVNTALKGKKLRINIYKDSSVTVATAQCAAIDLKRVDQKAENGLIHVLKSVMLPPVGNIVESVVACPKFKTLVTAVKAAGLVQALSGEGPFTLFAPTDKAFQNLPPGALDKLLANTTALRQVLLYHVVNLTYCSAGLATGLYGSITTLDNQHITIQVLPGGIKVNNANVIVADGSVSNGVVHAIDAVLIPPGLKL